MVAGVNDVVVSRFTCVEAFHTCVETLFTCAETFRTGVERARCLVDGVNDVVTCHRTAAEKPAPEAGKRTRLEKNLSTAGTRAAGRCGGRQPCLNSCHGVKMFSINKLEYYHKSLPVNNIWLG